jgi:hypothetical protein
MTEENSRGIPTKPREGGGGDSGIAEGSGEGGGRIYSSARIAGGAGCNGVSRVKRDHYRAQVTDPAGVYDGINIARCCRRRLGNRGEIDASPPRVFLLRRPLFFPWRGALMQRVKPNRRRGLLARRSLARSLSPLSPPPPLPPVPPAPFSAILFSAAASVPRARLSVNIERHSADRGATR